MAEEAREAGREAARAKRSEALQALRREMIVGAAKRIFAAHGLEAASMRAIAAEAGCTTGAIYPLFASKEHLYAAALSETLKALRAAVEARTAEAADGAGGAAGLRAFFDYYRARPEELSLGLYLFNGLTPQGLTAALDAALNDELRAAFAPIEAAFAAAGDADPNGRTAAGIAQAIGLLVLEQTGRLRLFERSAAELFEAYAPALDAPR